MASNARNTGGKPDSSASNSGSVSGESSGLRRSSRSNSSPGGVRKSPRLEKRVLETGTGTNTPGRRSGKSSPSSLSKAVKRISNDDGGDEVEEGNGGDSSVNDGKTRRKRMGARQFKAMFDDLPSVVETKSRKRKLEGHFDNVDSGDGGSLEEMSENCRKGVDSDNLKSEEELHVKCDQGRGGGGGNSDEGLRENCDEDVNRGITEPVEETHKCNDAVVMENIDGVSEGPYSDVNTNLGVEKSCEVEDGVNVNGLVREVNGSVVETLSNQDMQSASSRGNSNVNGSRCETFVAGGEDTPNDVNVVPPVSPTHKSRSPTEGCAKCSNKSRSDNDSSKQEPCTCDCGSNSTTGADVISVSKGRRECSDARDDDSCKTNGNDSLIGADESSCVLCKLGGNLLRCSGKTCQRSYHPSCLRNTEENSNTSFWYCSECIKKKMVLGVHSLSEGIESIFDAREVELTNCEGSLKEKQYFVKYKRLAHIHNCWIPETQLLHEAPELLTRLTEQNTGWNPKWAVPHRLLSKRSVTVHNQDTGAPLKSHREWLVKWCDLDYDHATWELEDSEIFKKPEVQQLMQEYETRHNCAKGSSKLGDNKIQERRRISHIKYGRVLDSYRAECVNKLLEFYQQSCNAVLFDEQDRMMKIIYFLSSILINVSRPFVIIAPLESLSVWEAEFLRITTSINVVVYSGKPDSRNIIRKLEFYGEGSELMFQVLLSSVEAISECCDHPYIVNPSLRKELLPEHPTQDAALDMGVKASGKLQLLDKLLSELRNQGLMVVIIFQSIGGSGKDNLELLLDDLLTWRFGKDSFEHVPVGSPPSKKSRCAKQIQQGV